MGILQLQVHINSILEQLKLQQIIFRRVTSLVMVDLAQFTRHNVSQLLCLYYNLCATSHCNDHLAGYVPEWNRSCCKEAV